MDRGVVQSVRVIDSVVRVLFGISEDEVKLGEVFRLTRNLLKGDKVSGTTSAMRRND